MISEKILILDHVKVQQEKDEKNNSLQPVPKKIYQINASLLSEKIYILHKYTVVGTSQIPRRGQPDLNKFYRLNLLGVLKKFLDKKRKKKSELPFQNLIFVPKKGVN